MDNWYESLQKEQLHKIIEILSSGEEGNAKNDLIRTLVLLLDMQDAKLGLQPKARLAVEADMDLVHEEMLRNFKENLSERSSSMPYDPSITSRTWPVPKKYRGG